MHSIPTVLYPVSIFHSVFVCDPREPGADVAWVMMQETANRATAAAAEWRYRNNSVDQRAPHVSVNNSVTDGVSKQDLQGSGDDKGQTYSSSN